MKTREFVKVAELSSTELSTLSTEYLEYLENDTDKTDHCVARNEEFFKYLLSWLGDGSLDAKAYREFAGGVADAIGHAGARVFLLSFDSFRWWAQRYKKIVWDVSMSGYPLSGVPSVKSDDWTASREKFEQVREACDAVLGCAMTLYQNTGDEDDLWTYVAVSLMHEYAISSAEIVQINGEDFDGYDLVIRGSDYRVLLLQDTAGLVQQLKDIRGNGPLFCNKSGNALAPATITSNVKKLGRIVGTRCEPSMFRVVRAVELIECGHSNVAEKMYFSAAAIRRLQEQVEGW